MTEFTPSPRASDPSLEEEAALVAAVRTGDQLACGRLVRLFAPRMMAVARRFMRCDEDCNDAVQDAFISAFNALARFEANSRLSTWLHRITVNACLMMLRLDSSRKEVSIEEVHPAFNARGDHTRWPAAIDDPAAEAETGETRTIVRQAIDQLPDADRQVLLLRDIEEMDTAATAARLKTSKHNVKRRLRRARRTLCSRLERR